MALSSINLDELRTVLQAAVVKCSERCLYQSAKWAAELLNSLPSLDPISPSDTEIASPSNDAFNVPGAAASAAYTQNQSPREAVLEAQEFPKYILAKTFFDCKEFDRAAAVFLPLTLPKGELRSPKTPARQHPKGSHSRFSEHQTSSQAIRDNEAALNGFPLLSQKALFLALYSKYISGEKRKEEDREIILGPADSGGTINRELLSIAQVLEARLSAQEATGEEGQGWLEYLYGVIHAKQNNSEGAKRWLIRSVQLYPYNWAAWQELAQLLGSNEEYQILQTQPLPRNIMSYIFHVYAQQELFMTSDGAFAALKTVKSIFPTSSFLRTQKALLYYHGKDYPRAERCFAKILAAEPLRLDALDAYSNILYVMDKRPKLAFLSQLTSATDKFRPETCCVVGNYYAMKSEHEKAVVYFRRALTLDPSFLSAWTLMGHEYVEMKNTQAAIECYRRAVDVQRKDYRAWYGLGQTYEMLDMCYYALFYYQRAAALSPYDPKMWAAVGTCLSKLERHEQAIKALKRALAAGSYYDTPGGGPPGGLSFVSRSSGGSRAEILDPDILFAIADSYDRLHEAEECKAYLELVLVQEEGPAAAATAAEEGGAMPAADFNRSTASTGGGGGAGVPRSAEGPVQGVGVTQTTSRARLWLVKIEMQEASNMLGEALQEAMARLDADGGERRDGDDHEHDDGARQRRQRQQRRGGEDRREAAAAAEQQQQQQPPPVSPRTKRARALDKLRRAMELANELCQDGFEVEEAKGLVREIRSRLGGNGGDGDEAAAAAAPMSPSLPSP